MKVTWKVLTFVLLALWLVACGPAASDEAPSATIPFVEVTPEAQVAATNSIPSDAHPLPVEASPVPTGSPLASLETAATLSGAPVDTSGGLPPAVGNVRLQHAMQRGLDPSNVTVEGLESVVWTDNCLNTALEGMACQPANIAGYRFTLVDGGQRYVYHSDEVGAVAHLVEAPPVDAGEVWLEWRNANIPCQRIVIGAGGLIYGECGLPMVRSLVEISLQDGDFAQLFATYLPFDADTAAGHVAFNGKGTVVAAASEQRMIAEWTKFTRDVVWSGRAGAAWGLAITWVSEPDCATVNVTLMGLAYATRCDINGVDRDLGQMRLNADQLATLYAIIDTYQGFEWSGAAAGSTISVQVAGRGNQWPTSEQQSAASDFVRELLFAFPTQGYEFAAP